MSGNVEMVLIFAEFRCDWIAESLNVPRLDHNSNINNNNNNNKINNIKYDFISLHVEIDTPT